MVPPDEIEHWMSGLQNIDDITETSTLEIAMFLTLRQAMRLGILTHEKAKELLQSFTDKDKFELIAGEFDSCPNAGRVAYVSFDIRIANFPYEGFDIFGKVDLVRVYS